MQHIKLTKNYFGLNIKLCICLAFSEDNELHFMPVIYDFTFYFLFPNHFPSIYSMSQQQKVTTHQFFSQVFQNGVVEVKTFDAVKVEKGQHWSQWRK